jgi:hypothetical protein
MVITKSSVDFEERLAETVAEEMLHEREGHPRTPNTPIIHTRYAA